MKKVLALVAVTGILAAASFASAASIVNSKHNLASTGSGAFKGAASDSSQICVYCHAPHGAAKSLPLWNRTNPGATLFTLYSGVNMASVSFKSGFTADSTSLFCMSCHDGQVNMNAVHNEGALGRLGAAAGTAGQPLYDATLSSLTLGESGNLGRNLSTTHPINFPVTIDDTVQKDLWIAGATLTTTSMGGGAGTTVTTFPLFKTVADAGMSAARGNNRSLECGSCHAVHDSANTPFLRFTMEGSKLCLGCHNK